MRLLLLLFDDDDLIAEATNIKLEMGRFRIVTSKVLRKEIDY
jgi:hypothetical protein